MPKLNNVVFLGNDIYEKYSNKDARLMVLKKLPKSIMIDNIMVSVSDRKAIQTEEK